MSKGIFLKEEVGFKVKATDKNTKKNTKDKKEEKKK